MIPSVEVMARLAVVATQQWGLLTTAQARTVGVSPQRLKALADSGVLHRVRHGVYAGAIAANEDA
jgi:predicted transcriptional regulator of viral defense system